MIPKPMSLDRPKNWAKSTPTIIATALIAKHNTTYDIAAVLAFITVNPLIRDHVSDNELLGRMDAWGADGASGKAVRGDLRAARGS